MEVIKKFGFLVYLLFYIGILSASAQNVSNVEFAQEGKMVKITYSLDAAAEVSVAISTDGGSTYSSPLKHVSGDVGTVSSPGRKTITWDALAEYDKMVGERICFKVSASGGKGTVNGHEWVDLGLPSGTKWATMNVGATSPSDYGNYYAWGETSTKSTYTWENLKYCLDASGDKFSKYVTDSKFGNVDGKTELDPSDDAAHVNWGSGWRMPSRTQQDELREKCKWTWTTLGGHKGYKVVGTNGNSIFLPAAGYRREGSLNLVGSDGNYWSRTRGLDSQGDAFHLFFSSSLVDWYRIFRYFGQSVRAVLAP